MTEAASGWRRINWLWRRLRRTARGELPHRVFEGFRMLSQSLGINDASRVPTWATDARFGTAWVRVPALVELDATGVRALLVEADRLVHQGPTLFGHATPRDNAWNADPRTQWQPKARFGLFVDFRHLPSGVDVKFMWELNRHLWWIPLAQAYALTRNRVYLDRLQHLLESWLDQCAYPNGPNWSSPVEHGVRLIVWSLVWHLVGGRQSELFQDARGSALLQRWTDSVYQHIRFASDNYSLFSSANNHLVGEAAGVFVAAHCWDLWPEVRVLREQAKQLLEREMQLQFRADGLNAEQAMCYHKFALQFMLAAALTGRACADNFSQSFDGRLDQALVALAALMDCKGQVPMYGDADDGEVFRLDASDGFCPYAALVDIGAALTRKPEVRAKAASIRVRAGMQKSWLLALSGEGSLPSLPVEPNAVDQLPTYFRDAGIVLLGTALHSHQELRAQLDVGPLGYNHIAGHGHADALSLQLSIGGEALLVDPGTYCYNAEPSWRHYFRSTRAHNTLEVDGLDQSLYGGSFLWLRDVECQVRSVQDDGRFMTVVAQHSGYGHLRDPVVHNRRVVLDRDQRRLVVEDWISCRQAHDVALHWHMSPRATVARTSSNRWLVGVGAQTLALEVMGQGLSCAVVVGVTAPIQGWHSDRFYHRTPAPVLVVRGHLEPGQRLVTEIGCPPMRRDQTRVEANPAMA